VSAEEAGMWK